jgi:imidazolonepropionase-like amidohydrolase
LGGDADGELPNIHRELELLVDEAGFTPLQAIAAATSITARAIGVENTVGTIAPCKHVSAHLKPRKSGRSSKSQFGL